MKPVCIPCQKEYRIDKNGVYVIETFGHPPKPYKIWSADRWICPSCGHQLLSGFGQGPLAEHFGYDFPDRLHKAMTSGDYVMVLE